jgi:ADP-heptose:LPS heptosyltransferase
MGDVALTVPVIKALAEQHKEHQISLLTNKLFNPFFAHIPNLAVINPDLKVKHKGVIGLYKLFKSLKEDVDPDIVFDLHDVIRTKIIRFFFLFTKVKAFKISKGRREKRNLTKRKNKKLKELKHTVLRYRETLIKGGIVTNLENTSQNREFRISDKAKQIIENNFVKVGIAPFAKHFQKQYPLEKSKELIRLLSERGYRIYIFGGGKKEQAFAKEMEKSYKSITSLVNKYPLQDEIALIDKTDVMITMDSANMHIAALTGTNIVSVWGATHPFAGFTPFTKTGKTVYIQNEKLVCRPCSVYGNKECYIGTFECMESISPEEIAEACERFLNTKQL